ncbi:GGDEF domain-containing protein [Malaciobacter halophilus]|nr:GGDEF domain-containing protein [Malaciobacter halophilus]RYA22378.1 GGDEF domain-containing protein [Malaciobacter halophilus]
MSNIMVNSFRQILEDQQKNIEHAEFTINEDKKIVKLFVDSLRYLAISLSNSHNVKNLKILFKDSINNYNEIIFETKNGTFNPDFKLTYLINLSQNVIITYEIYCSDEQHYHNLEINNDALVTTFDIISQTLYNKYLEECIKELSLKDQITGLYNRKYLENYLEMVISLSKRENKKIGFLKIGIDKFKAVIDEFDYNIGDNVLITLAELLKDTVRSSDIVARIDGDEFLVVLQNVRSQENAIMIAKKIIESFSKKEILVNEKTGQTLLKTICIGISLFPDNAKTIEEILNSSDNALYEAKNKGRNEFFVYNDSQMHTIDLF